LSRYLSFRIYPVTCFERFKFKCNLFISVTESRDTERLEIIRNIITFGVQLFRKNNVTYFLPTCGFGRKGVARMFYCIVRAVSLSFVHRVGKQRSTCHLPLEFISTIASSRKYKQKSNAIISNEQLIWLINRMQLIVFRD